MKMIVRQVYKRSLLRDWRDDIWNYLGVKSSDNHGVLYLRADHFNHPIWVATAIDGGRRMREFGKSREEALYNLKSSMILDDHFSGLWVTETPSSAPA